MVVESVPGGVGKQGPCTELPTSNTQRQEPLLVMPGHYTLSQGTRESRVGVHASLTHGESH